MEVPPYLVEVDKVGEGVLEGKFDLAPVLAQFRRDSRHAKERKDLLLALERLQFPGRRVREAVSVKPVTLFLCYRTEPV